METLDGVMDMGLFDRAYMKPKTQAKAVREYLDGHDGVEVSWDNDVKEYARVEIAEWHNCREVGFVVMFWNKKNEQLNIAFFEHRNSDEICAIKWVQKTLNPPTIESAVFGDVYKDKYDVSHSAGYGKASDMADWIMDQLSAHWTI